MNTPAYYMNDSREMHRKLACVRYGESCTISKADELKFSFVMVDTAVILTIADSENLNYAQAIQDGIEFLNTIYDTETIGNYSVCHYQYNERANMSTYYIYLSK